ncbi:hypothetical protein [Amycolatopsis cihanbeyliensis]|uniref:Mce-associated membrane protein n=1 Tax=Amycolatopsis cihanbeyliensis TaxID=1128664 RepID=A0A542DFR2_AMYCI|nr:hypothetical protein [Amycolatopsis cihanbeyliensis]TQJ01923.1 Mce-associated membrane protein [Amycolatopsis cihanbeyliensis]
MSSGRLPKVLAGLVAVAVLAAGWFGWAWWSAAHDEGLAVARARDTVRAAVVHGLVTLNTIDHRHAERDVEEWIRVTTGRLHEDLSGDRQLQLDRAAGTRAVSSARVLRSAVTELDRAEGTARLIAVLEVTVRTEKQPDQRRRSRLIAEAKRTEGGWKVSTVQAAGA